MRKLRTLHIYGSTVLESDFCERCGADSFIIQGKLVCCGSLPPHESWKDLKIEIDTSNKRRKRPPWYQRQEILSEQNNCCFYCEDEFGTWRHVSGTPRIVQLQWDHVVPFSFNGNNYEFVAACRECNQAKGALHFSDALEAKQFLQLKMHERKTA